MLSFLSHTESCKLEPFFGGNVVETQEISADAVVHDIRCASGYKTLNQSTDGTIQCKTNGSWTTFPRCEGDLSTLFFFFLTTVLCNKVVLLLT